MSVLHYTYRKRGKTLSEDYRDAREDWDKVLRTHFSDVAPDAKHLKRLMECEKTRFQTFGILIPFLAVREFLIVTFARERGEKRKRRLSSGNAANCPLEFCGFRAEGAADINTSRRCSRDTLIWSSICS